jgi:vacuolar-type H+-ATPase subunit E/Vma4
MAEAGTDADEAADPAERLVEHVQRRSNARRRAVLEEALEEAHRVRAEAFAKARARLAEAAAEERARAAAARRGVQAQTESEVRARRHELAQETLDALRGRLDEALAARWSDAEARAAWIGAAARCAAAVMPAERWTLEHGPEDDGETLADTAREALRDAPGIAPEADEAIASGVRLRAGGACLDATGAGLTVKEGRVRARLLAALIEEAGEEAAPLLGEEESHEPD